MLLRKNIALWSMGMLICFAAVQARADSLNLTEYYPIAQASGVDVKYTITGNVGHLSLIGKADRVLTGATTSIPLTNPTLSYVYAPVTGYQTYTDPNQASFVMDIYFDVNGAVGTPRLGDIHNGLRVYNNRGSLAEVVEFQSDKLYALSANTTSYQFLWRNDGVVYPGGNSFPFIGVKVSPGSTLSTGFVPTYATPFDNKYNIGVADVFVTPTPQASVAGACLLCFASLFRQQFRRRR